MCNTIPYFKTYIFQRALGLEILKQGKNRFLKRLRVMQVETSDIRNNH